MILVLLGYMGSGKSAVGQKLSGFLGSEFVDLDRYIELNESMSISDVFKHKGSIYFRKIEHKYLTKLLTQNQNMILSLGGGTPCYYNHMDLMEQLSNVNTLYLKASANTLSNRLWLDRTSRPLISSIDNKDVLLEYISKHLFERQYYYLQADYSIKTDQLSVDQAAQQIVELLF